MGALGWLMNLKFRGGRATIPKINPLQVTLVASANCVVPVASNNSITLVNSDNCVVLL